MQFLVVLQICNGHCILIQVALISGLCGMTGTFMILLTFIITSPTLQINKMSAMLIACSYVYVFTTIDDNNGEGSCQTPIYFHPKFND